VNNGKVNRLGIAPLPQKHPFRSGLGQCCEAYWPIGVMTRAGRKRAVFVVAVVFSDPQCCFVNGVPRLSTHLNIVILQGSERGKHAKILYHSCG